MINPNLFNVQATSLDERLLECNERLTPLLRLAWNDVSNRMPLFKNLLIHLMHVILQFLNDDDAGLELFIRIPVEDLANRNRNGNDALQDSSFSLFQGAIVTCLQLATIQSHLQRRYPNRVPDDVTYPGEWYNDEDQFIAFSNADDSIHIITCDEIRRGGVLRNRLTYQEALVRRRQYPRTCNDGPMGNRYRAIYKINPDDTINAAYIRRYRAAMDLENLMEIANQLQVRQFNQAAFIRPAAWRPKLMFDNQEEFVLERTRIRNLHLDDNADIIIVCGLDRYINNRNLLRNKLTDREGPKKIIYIGTEKPDNDNNIPIYEFTYREIYRYCRLRGGVGEFQEPELMRNIPFPWLSETKRALTDMLLQIEETDEDFTPSVRTSVERKLTQCWADKDFCREFWIDKRSRICEGLEDVLQYCSQETIDTVIDWVNNLNYEYDTNPKRDWINRNRQECGRRRDIPNILELGKYDSYKKKIKNLYGYNNLIIIDRASNYKSQDNASSSGYQYALYRCLFAKIVGLYYAEEDYFANRLERFLEREQACYTSELRRKYGTSFNLQDIIQDEEQTTSDAERFDGIRLEDFLNDDDWAISVWGKSENTRYSLVFNNGESVDYTGDVLTEVDGILQRINISDVEFEDSDVNSKHIIYYINPDDFEELMRSYCNLPRGEEVSDYAQLWKAALREYIKREQTIGSDIKDIIKRVAQSTSLPTRTIQRYSNNNCEHSFMQSEKNMRNMCQFLRSNNLLSRQEDDYVLASRRLYYNHSKFGKQLKDEVFSYKLGETQNLEMLNRLVQNTNRTMEDIVNTCICEGDLVSVLELKTNK